MKRTYILTVIAFLAISFGCNKSSIRDGLNNEKAYSIKDSIEDFYVFVEVFKTDTAFQKSRTVFPISILYRKSADGVITKKVYTKAEWEPLNYYLPEEIEPNYSNKYFHKNDTMVHELREIGYRLNKNFIFTLRENKWFLVQIDDKTIN